MRGTSASWLFVLASCASANPSPSGAAGQCAVTLEPRRTMASRPAPLPPPEAPESLVLVHAEMPLAPLRQQLEQRVPKQLADGRTRIGPGGTVTYTVERGALSLRVTRTSLLIETPARAEARACRGDDCYASCEPEARIVAEVPLMLRPDYGFQRSTVTATFTRGCKVRALGGFLSIDVTPTLEGALRPELDKVARQIDAQLPELRSQRTQAWSELNKPREVPLGGCFVLQPYGVVQGAFEDSATVLSGRFAVRAHPELRASCGEAPSVSALPPLQTDATLPEEGTVRLGMVTPLERLAQAFSTPAKVTSHGAKVDAELTLSGQVCGDVGLEATPDFSGDGQYIGLSNAALWPGERERLGDGKLDVTELVGKVHVAPLLSVQGFKDAAPALAKNVVQPGLEVSASVSSTRAAGATARGSELVAWLEARGAIWLKTSSVPAR